MKTIKKIKNKKFMKTMKTMKNKYKKKNKFNNRIKGGSGKSKTIKKINCSPKTKDELNDFSCYTNKSLIKLRDSWNARHPDVKITSNHPKEIHNKLGEYLKDICNNEACWLRQKGAFGKLESELSDSFAPESPPEWKKNPNEWLSSTDITKVMKQYEKAYKEFDFIGPSPIDFDTRKLYGECVWEELCNFNLEKLIKQGKTKIGIIFNTDPHNKPGQHWISMFINITSKKIFFFDSTGDTAPKEIKKLIERIKEQGLYLKAFSPYKIRVDPKVVEFYKNLN